MLKKKISITLDSELVTKIDKKRGLIPRSVYIDFLLKKKYKLIKNGKK